MARADDGDNVDEEEAVIFRASFYVELYYNPKREILNIRDIRDRAHAPV